MVAQAADLLEFVGNVEHRPPLAFQLAQSGKERVGLLRGQDRCRLVHDQEPRVLEQAADNFHPLALSGRELCHTA